MVTRMLEWARDMVRGNTEDSDNRRTLRDADVPEVTDWLSNLARRIDEAATSALPPVVGPALARLGGRVLDCDRTVQGLESCMTAWIMDEISPVLDLSVASDRSKEVEGEGVSSLEEIARFERDVESARAGAAGASVTVTALSVAAAAADGATQVLSLGQIQGFQQLIQNVIWATGLADLGGLSFRPQVAASFQPLLDRHYNRVAQARMPQTGDLIRFQVRRVFEPERRDFLAAASTPQAFRDWMKQQGFSEFWADSYWGAHWRGLGQTQLDDMLHKGILNERDWREQAEFNDFLGANIDWLFGIAYSEYTRVDVRRMEDLGVLSRQELLEGYANLGYFAPRAEGGKGRAQFAVEVGQEFNANVHKAEALTTFAQLQGVIPSLRRRLSNGFVRPEEVEPELLRLGLPAETAKRKAQELVDAEDLDSAVATRQLTAAQIVRGARDQLISWAQGQFLLEQMGYSEARAEYLLRLMVFPEDSPLDSELGRRLLGGE